MILLQIMCLIFGCLIILILIVERARKRYFKLMDNLLYIRERNKKIRKDVEDIFGIYEGIKNIATTMDIEEVLKMMGQLIRKYFEFSHSRLYLFGEEDGNFYSAMQYDFSINTLLNEKTEITDENIRNVIMQRRETVSPEEKKIQEFMEEGQDRPEIFMIVPLIVEDKVIGAVEMEREKEPFLPFSSDDLHKLSNLCAQTSVILRRARLYREVERLAIIDGLTGLYVHRYFQEKMALELKRAKTYGEAFCLVMADIDFFKRYNDQYGHQAGDELLRRVARVLKEGVRDTDIVARYGGEEFVIVLLHRGMEEATVIAEELRRKTETLRLEIEGGSTGVTISLGVAAFPGAGSTVAEIVKCADEALYKAKEGGRNRMVAYKK